MNAPAPLRDAPHRFDELAAWTARHREEILEPELPIVDPHPHVWLDHRGR